MKILKTRGSKVLFLFALCLAVCALLPMASSSASVQVERPIYVEGTGTILDVMSGPPYTYFSEGVANHIGRHSCVCKLSSLDYGRCLVFAANGDQLYFEMNGGTMTITGGTGRFNNASGSWDSVVTSESYSMDPWGGVVASVTYEGEGTIVY